jgi:hypothetical protein
VACPGARVDVDAVDAKVGDPRNRSRRAASSDCTRRCSMSAFHAGLVDQLAQPRQERCVAETALEEQQLDLHLRAVSD